MEMLSLLLNTISTAVIGALRTHNADAAATLANVLVPLRMAWRDWPSRAELPPVGVLLGCFQALLRGEEQQLVRLRAQLDEGMAQALAQVERLIAADDQTLREAARDTQITELRAQVAQAMPQALTDTDLQRRERFINWLEQTAAQAADDEQPGSPWQALAAYLRACAALLRGEPFDREGLEEADIAQLNAWAHPLTLDEAIQTWVKGNDETRQGYLLPLLNAVAQIVVSLHHAGDTDGADALATSLIPLRTALRDWPAAAELPPFGAFLGCLQALLRGQEAQLSRLRMQLDEGLAQTLKQIEEICAEST
jgi:hypothetical protein